MPHQQGHSILVLLQQMDGRMRYFLVLTLKGNENWPPRQFQQPPETFPAKQVERFINKAHFSNGEVQFLTPNLAPYPVLLKINPKTPLILMTFKQFDYALGNACGIQSENFYTALPHP